MRLNTPPTGASPRRGRSGHRRAAGSAAASLRASSCSSSASTCFSTFSLTKRRGSAQRRLVARLRHRGRRSELPPRSVPPRPAPTRSAPARAHRFSPFWSRTSQRYHGGAVGTALPKSSPRRPRTGSPRSPPVSDERVTRGMERQLTDRRRDFAATMRHWSGSWDRARRRDGEARHRRTRSSATCCRRRARRVARQRRHREVGQPEARAGNRSPAVGEDGGIAAIGAAIELIDLDPGRRRPRGMLARDVFQRHVLLKPGPRGRQPRRRLAEGHRRR